MAKMDKYGRMLVVDLEATCENPQPRGFVQEVVEVGVVLFNTTTLEIEEEASIMVIPTTGHISAFCTQLTTITPEMVTKEAGAVSFPEAMRQLRMGKWDSSRCAWASWGDFDRTLIEKQCAREGMVSPFGPSHLNLKGLARLMLPGTHAPGAKEASEIFGIPWQGTHHRGLDDARMIARCFGAMLKRMRNG